MINNIIILFIICLILITLYFVYYRKNYNNYNLIFISCLLIISIYIVFQYLYNEKTIQVYENFRINDSEEPDEIIIHPDSNFNNKENEENEGNEDDDYIQDNNLDTDDDPLNNHNFKEIENYNADIVAPTPPIIPVFPPTPNPQLNTQQNALPNTQSNPQPNPQPTSLEAIKEPMQSLSQDGLMKVGDIQQTNAGNGNMFMPQIIVGSNEGRVINAKETEEGYVWDPSNNFKQNEFNNINEYDLNGNNQLEKYYKQNEEQARYKTPYEEKTKQKKRFNPVDYYAGYAIMPPKYWDTFKPKPPPCIPDKWIRPSAVFTTGTPVNVLELDENGKMLINENNTTYTNASRDKKNVRFSNVGSILPKGNYTENYNY